jgi:hypothetical protein
MLFLLLELYSTKHLSSSKCRAWNCRFVLYHCMVVCACSVRPPTTYKFLQSTFLPHKLKLSSDLLLTTDGTPVLSLSALQCIHSGAVQTYIPAVSRSSCSLSASFMCAHRATRKYGRKLTVMTPAFVCTDRSLAWLAPFGGAYLQTSRRASALTKNSPWGRIPSSNDILTETSSYILCRPLF